MIIALDYDGTYTADHDLWDEFIKIVKIKCHKIYIVTMTRTEEKERMRQIVDGIIYSGKTPKKDYCDSKGIYFDIWIDDSPELLSTGIINNNQ